MSRDYADIATIVARLDALDAGPINVDWAEPCQQVQADIPALQIRAESTVNSLFGTGSSADEAIKELWKFATNLEPGLCLVIRAGAPDRRYVRWNGAAWKSVEAPS